MRTVLIILLLFTSSANADYGGLAGLQQAPDVEASGLFRRDLESRWQRIIDAPKTFGWWRVDFHGKSFTGEWVVRLEEHTYFIAAGKAICSAQSATSVTCGEYDPELEQKGRFKIVAAARQPVPTVAMLRTLSRALVGHDVAMTIDRGVGTGTLEHVVRDPPAAKISARRFRVAVTYRADRFEVTPVQLVETFEERCMPTHGCHAVHWNCQRP